MAVKDFAGKKVKVVWLHGGIPFAVNGYIIAKMDTDEDERTLYYVGYKLENELMAVNCSDCFHIQESSDPIDFSFKDLVSWFEEVAARNGKEYGFKYTIFYKELEEEHEGQTYNPYTGRWSWL
jgi:hypothetical protein